jgi:predicted GIY-YIG superfamily endonuclease
MAGFLFMKYRVYVLRNPDGRHYIGLSEDVAKRLVQHNAGESKWTAKHRPWELLWQSMPMSLSEARKFENLLKRQKRGVGFYRLTGLQPPTGS